VALYIDELTASVLPWPYWVVVLLWATLFAASHALHLRAQSLTEAQAHIRVPTGLGTSPPRRLIISQLFFACAVFALGVLLGPVGFAFFGGGWVIATGVAATSNLRSVLLFRELGRRDAATGSLALSAQAAIREQAAQLAAAVVFCLVVALLVPHVSLLGGAFFLAALAAGYVRRARGSQGA
jgi:hypothetical protein